MKKKSWSHRLKSFKRMLRVPFEWLGIGLGLLVFTNLPRRVLLCLCDVVSRVFYRFDTRGKAWAEKNLTIIFGERLTPGRTEKIIRRSYRNMARTVGHAFWTCRNAKARAAAAGEMSPEGVRFLAANKPAITVSGHIGCWEIMSQLAFLEGHKMMSVAKDIGSSGMTKLLMKARRSIGQEIVPAEGAFRPLMQGLKDGKSLGLLVDQAVSPKKGGVWVRMFGRPVPVSAAPAFFAAKGKAPIVVAWSRPLKDGRWRCEIVNTYPAETARDIWGMTQNCIRDLERVIRRHPSCWVLNYNQWSNDKGLTPDDLDKLLKQEAKRV